MVGVAAADSLALSSGQFATKLSAVLQPGDFFSPASIQHALALVAAGASGQTLAELQSALLWPMSPNWQQELGAFFAGLYEAMAAGEPVLSVANRVYTKVPVKPEYAAAVSSVFHATIEPLTTADNINNFVSEATRGMIKEIVKDEHVQSSVLIAVNALYFKGKWAVCFDAARTTIAPFRSLAQPSTCHMMQTPAEKKWRYYEDAHAQYIMLPYRDAAGAESSLVALVALPRAETANALASVDWPQVLQALGGHEKRKGTLWMPRFALESTMHLSEALKSLGATRAFSTSAEFPLVSDSPMMIDEVIHKVRVEVDEEGTVAAAATAVVASFGCAAPSGPPPFQMRCERPFAFCVVSMRSSPLVLFAGTVTDPGCVGPVPAVQFPQASMAPQPFAPQPFAPQPFSVPAPVPPPSPPRMSAAQRSEQACLFTPDCRRDVYRVLCSVGRRPLLHQPTPNSAPSSAFQASSPRHGFTFGGPIFGERPATADGGFGGFGGSPQASTPGPFGPGTPPNATAEGGFGRPVAPPRPPPSTHAPIQWVLAQRSSTTFTSIDAISVLARGDAIQTTLAMLEHVGQPTDVGIAFTEAFETLLVNELVGWWTDEDAATLSAAFTVAFGQELTPRLDMEHAIRSRALSPSEVEWLRQLPQCIVFNKNLINVFQGTAS